MVFIVVVLVFLFSPRSAKCNRSDCRTWRLLPTQWSAAVRRAPAQHVRIARGAELATCQAPPTRCDWSCGHSRAPVTLRLKRPHQKWVARAARPPRSATRRPEMSRATLRKDRPYPLEPSLPFRPASRRTAQAGRLCYQKRFSNRAHGQSPLSRKNCSGPVSALVKGLVTPRKLVNVPVTAGAVCKLKPALVQLSTSWLLSS